MPVKHHAGEPVKEKKRAGAETAFLTFWLLLLQALVVAVYTHDISPNYRETRPRYHTPKTTERVGRESTRELIFDTPSLAVKSREKEKPKKEVTQKSVYCRLPCMLAACPERDRPNSRFAHYPKTMNGPQMCFGPFCQWPIMYVCQIVARLPVLLTTHGGDKHICMSGMLLFSEGEHLCAYSSPVHKFRRAALNLAP